MRFLTAVIVLLVLLLSACQPLAVPAQSMENQEIVTVFVEGAPIHHANGVHFGPDNHLYIASVTGREIIVMDPDSGEVLDRLGPDRGVEGPDDLVVGPDGALYWTSFFTGEIGRLSPEGVKSTAAQLTTGVNPITISDDGRLFTALCFTGDALYEVDPDGVDEPRLIAENVGDGCASNGMDWGPDGLLYGPRWFQGQVVRTNVDTGETETVVDGLSVPASLKFDSHGRLHVIDALTGEVARVDIETGNKEVIATIMPGLDSLAFDAEDRLYVSSFSEGYIVEVLDDGTTRLVSEGGLAAPGGVAVHGDSIFVADVLSLREIDAHTGEEISITRDVIGFSPLGAPFTVSSAGDTLLVSSWFGNVVQEWDPENQEVLATFGEVNVPMNAIGFQGDVVVAELGTGSVVQLNADDSTQRIVLAEGLVVPTGLAATDDDLWVADWATGSILQLVADGEVQTEPTAVATSLQFPEGLAVTADGYLLVVETGTGSLLSVDPVTAEVRPIATNLAIGMPGIEGFPPTWIFNGVAVDTDGTIFVSGDSDNALYRIEPRP